MRFQVFVAAAALIIAGCNGGGQQQQAEQGQQGQPAQQQQGAQQVSQDVANTLQNSVDVLNKMQPQIANSAMNQAQCVAVFPSVNKAALIAGGRWGEGAASCKTDSGWSPPVMLNIGGGSFGAQAGWEETELVLLVMNQKGKDALMGNNWQVGASTSVAAGPGAKATAKANPRADVLTYSGAEGVFIGASLTASTIQINDDAMRNLYGQTAGAQAILMGQAQVTPPPPAEQFTQAVQQAAGGGAQQQAAAGDKKQ